LKKITPFRGLRYNPEIAGDPTNLLAPPYDVIPPELQEELYGKSPYNIVRLILGKRCDNDTDSENRYTRSAEDIDRWIKDGGLKREDKEAVYVYSQTYTVKGETKTRIGFIARKMLEEFGGSIKPHENTLSGPKTDRLNLTRACRCNFSCIFGLFSDPTMTSDSLLKEAMRKKPDMDATMQDGQRHRLWVVTDESWIAKLTQAVEEKPVIIADGHHRYETALNYMKEKTGSGEATDDVKYVMMYFTNTESEGMTILPTHRLARNLTDFTIQDFLAQLAPEFEVREIPSANEHRNDQAEQMLAQEMRGAGSGLFGLYSGKGRYHLLKYVGAGNGNPLEKLDVGILHRRILEAKLGIGAKELAAQSHIKYSQDMDNTARKVDEEDYQLAFFLNPTPVEHLRMITEAGLKMPQKSTYFYPKLISGLVINPLF